MARRHRIATTLLLLSAGCAPALMTALTDGGGYPLVGNVMSKGGKDGKEPRPKPRPHPDGGGAPRPLAEAERAGPAGEGRG
jgi:hypothetical protein